MSATTSTAAPPPKGGELCISIIIPCRNEEKYIEQCLRSVVAFEVPPGYETEILVLDGRSDDATREITLRLAREYPSIRLLDNPGLIQSCALNQGIRLARGEWILRLDAHSRYGPEYLRLCWETAQRTGAENIGGLFITQPGGNGPQAYLVQALTTHRFGVGNAGFRIGATEGSVDTVPYGFFPRRVFEKLGGFDERLVRHQDYELNRRIIAAGGKIWLNPAIHVFYFNQPTLAAFYRKQFFKEAPFNPYCWYLAPYAFAYRHAITGAFAAGIIGGCVLGPVFPRLGAVFAGVMALYGVLAIVSAAQQALRYRRPSHLLWLPFCFFGFHFIHGLGVLKGLFNLAVGAEPVQRVHEPWPGAGRRRAWPPASAAPDAAA